MNEDIERQMQALGMGKVETNEDKVHRVMVKIAARTKQPVKMVEMVQASELTRNQVQGAVHRLIITGRAYYYSPKNRRMGLYVPKVV